MMNKWNMSNPLVKIMINYYQELEAKTYEYTKKGIIYTIIMVLMSIVTIGILSHDLSSLLIYILTVVIFHVITLRYIWVILSTIKRNDVTDMILGNEFATIDVNNEKLFEIMCKIKGLDGKVSVLTSYHPLILVIYTLISVMCVSIVLI